MLWGHGAYVHVPEGVRLEPVELRLLVEVRPEAGREVAERVVTAVESPLGFSSGGESSVASAASSSANSASQSSRPSRQASGTVTLPWQQ